MSARPEAAPASSTIAIFPDARRTRLVTRVAAGLLRLEHDAEAMDAYCDGVTAELLERMCGLGLAEADQDEAIGAFFSAVEERRAALGGEAACACCGGVQSL